MAMLVHFVGSNPRMAGWSTPAAILSGLEGRNVVCRQVLDHYARVANEYTVPRENEVLIVVFAISKEALINRSHMQNETRMDFHWTTLSLNIDEPFPVEKHVIIRIDYRHSSIKN